MAAYDETNYQDYLHKEHKKLNNALKRELRKKRYKSFMAKMVK